MKKTFLLLVLTTLTITTNSCSKDNDVSTEKIYGTISMKVNGFQKTFNVTQLSENLIQAGTPEEYTEISLFANENAGENASGDGITFSIKKGDLGNNGTFTYVKEGDMGYITKDNFSTNITSNGADKKIIGTFSGDLGGIEELTVTEGLLDIEY